MFDYSDLDKQALPQGETRREPLPQTDGVLAQVTEGKWTGGQGKNGPWTRYDVTLEIRDEAYLKSANMTAASIRYGIMVDVENGQIAMGPNKNLRLNRYRAACGANVPGKSLPDCIGAMLKVAIGHRPSGENDPETGKPIIYDDVQGVTKA